MFKYLITQKVFILVGKARPSVDVRPSMDGLDPPLAPNTADGWCRSIWLLKVYPLACLPSRGPNRLHPSALFRYRSSSSAGDMNADFGLSSFSFPLLLVLTSLSSQITIPVSRYSTWGRGNLSRPSGSGALTTAGLSRPIRDGSRFSWRITPWRIRRAFEFFSRDGFQPHWVDGGPARTWCLTYAASTYPPAPVGNCTG